MPSNQPSSQTENITPAVVVVAYKRPNSLRRLLTSLTNATYPRFVNIPLIISIDHPGVGTSECAEVARAFTWPNGERRIIEHSENLGLRNHILLCGDLSAEFGAVIVLEDDLYVSPYFYQYALIALRFYGGLTDDIGGIALFSYDVCEQTRHRFIPLDDGYDNYFLQIAASSGQMWTESQWRIFRAWYSEHAEDGVTPEHGVPPSICGWPETSWKKYYIRYLVDTGRYFVYPRIALSTNFGDIGTHDASGSSWDQTPLLLAEKNYCFSTLAQSSAVYDCFFEPSPHCLKRLNPKLSEYEFDSDLYGLKGKEAIGSPYLLSSKTCTRPIQSFGLHLIPEAANIAYAVEGDYFHLGHVENFRTASFSKALVAKSHIHKVSRRELTIGAWMSRIYRFLKAPLTR